MYDGIQVGDYVADIMVNGQILVEIKASKATTDAHLVVCIKQNATYRAGLLLV